MEEFLEQFLAFEEREKLFENQIRNLKYWTYIRTNIFYLIFNKLENIELISGSNRRSLLTMFKMLPMMFMKNPISFLKKKDLLIIGCGRRVKFDNIYKDIYVDYFLEELDFSYYVFEEDCLGKHYRPVNTLNLRYMDLFKFISYFEKIKLKILKKSVFDSEEKKQIQILIDKINREFNCKLIYEDMENVVESTVIYYFKWEKLINRIFDKIKPKVLIMQDHYALEHMIFTKIAKKRGIKVVELQHGVIGEYHIAYNYAKELNLEEFPDFIFTFGEYWGKNVRFPIPKNQIIATGFPYYEKMKFKYNCNLKEEKIILFISDSLCGIKLSKIAAELDVLIKATEYKIIYKLHPSESQNWKENYPWLIESDIKVIDDSNISIYEFFSRAMIQVGVGSTALFEGFGFELQTYIYDISHGEFGIELARLNYVTLFKDSKELFCYIENNKKLNFDDTFFWEKDSSEKINRSLKEIIGRKELF